MTIQKKFILFFVGFTLFVVLAISTVAIGFLKETYDRILNAANASYLPVMASHMFLKATITFVIISLVVVVISVPIGVLLSRWLSGPYLRIFKNIGDIAHKRFAIDNKVDLGNDERIILERYISLLMDDLNKLKAFEKEKAWKNGARLLMHELKNPLTPLKLSAQTLTLSDKSPEILKEEITRILSSVKDIETILSYFKELVNIEFGPLTSFDLKAHVRAFIELNGPAMPFQCTMPPGPTSFIILSEPTLLTMLFTNLIKNGLSENNREFHVDLSENSDILTMCFTTPNAHIDDTSKIFSLGYSTKGENRGFGLFLCKKISDYLDLNIQFNHEFNSVIFSISFKRYYSEDRIR
jgi:Signal transduction histidine kinase involved in nitrogen fixation and metabolism regulation